MDFKDLDKRQLILLTLLITFVVSVATAIISVSLVKQMPDSVPQTINNVIQRTIEKVTTVEVPASPQKAPEDSQSADGKDDSKVILGSSDSLIDIYSQQEIEALKDQPEKELKSLGQGIILSDVGLVLVESNILNSAEIYKVILNKKVFDATLLKKFNDEFAILKISVESKSPTPPTPSVDPSALPAEKI